MTEFKLKRGRKVYHIREFSSLLELTRRGLVAPDDPIFVPSVQRWVFARAIHELSPFLAGKPLRGDSEDDAVVLPLEFVEPLPETDVSGVDVDESTLGVDVEPSNRPRDGGETGGGGGFDVGGNFAGRQDVWSNPSADKILSQLDAVPAVPGGGAEGWHEPPGLREGGRHYEVDRDQRREREAGDFRVPRTDRRTWSDRRREIRNEGDGPDRDRSWQGQESGASLMGRGDAGFERRRGTEHRKGSAPPISFQDWMAEKAREGSLQADDAGLLPLLSGVDAVREKPDRVPVRWGRLLVISGVLVALFGAYFVYVKVIAEMEYEPLSSPSVVATPVTREQPVQGKEVSATPDPGLVATDYRMRSMVSPNVVAFRSFEQAEDRLFSELLNLKIGVADVKLIPVSGDTNRSVRRTESDVSVRLRPSSLSTEEQTGITGLVIGKYIARERLSVRDLIMRIERAGHPPVVRIVPGRAAAEYFQGQINYQQYLLAVQAGTVSP